VLSLQGCDSPLWEKKNQEEDRSNPEGKGSPPTPPSNATENLRFLRRSDLDQEIQINTKDKTEKPPAERHGVLFSQKQVLSGGSIQRNQDPRKKRNRPRSAWLDQHHLTQTYLPETPSFPLVGNTPRRHFPSRGGKLNDSITAPWLAKRIATSYSTIRKVPAHGRASRREKGWRTGKRRDGIITVRHYVL